ncbi:hypothetical protein N4307_14530, partial [Staphylococcus aureus]|nr:hypothetical protein [Staphylococcus aureus]
FLRQAELLIGPLTEIEGGGPSHQAYRLLSSGLDTDIRMRFSVDLSATSEPNKIVLAISNLATERWARMAVKNTLVQLSVGYQDTGLKL